MSGKLILLYFSISLLLLYFFRYNFEQDAISYLSIAKEYYCGNYSEADNGVWGPLISWLLVPFLFFKLEPLLSFKLLQILIGLFTLHCVILYLSLFELPYPFIKYLIFASFWIIECYIYLTLTPDLLLATLTLYLILIFLKQKKFSKKNSIYFGVLGALMYYSKPFGLPFFFALIFGYYSLFYNNREKLFNSQNVKHLFIITFTFIVITSPWIYSISNKYGHFTFSTGGEYNFAIVGPNYNGKHIPRIEKLYKPVNEFATSYWEDPTFLTSQNWNPFSSLNELYHLIKILLRNFINLSVVIFRFSPLLILLIVLVNPKYIFSSEKVRIILFAAIINILGLMILFIEQRFLIIVQIVLVIITGRYAIYIISKVQLTEIFKKVLFVIIAASLCLPSIYSLVKRANRGEDLYRIVIDLEKLINVSGNIASMSQKPLDEDWNSTLTICFLSNTKFYGEVNHLENDKNIYNELKKFNITYLFVWDIERSFNQNFFKQIYKDTIQLENSIIKKSKKNLFIYKVL